MRLTTALIFIGIFLNISPARSQALVFQEVHGIVADKGNDLPLEGVNILIKSQQYEKGTSTDKNGLFQFKEVPVGRYNLFISHIGYQEKIERDILVEAGKVKQVAIALRNTPYQLDEVTVFDNDAIIPEYALPSSHTFPIEQSQRFAATFYDPGRMALSFPGVTSANDQANNISIRGNSPFANKWKLEGADIVNPNHLINAGTFTDRVSVVGGGVSILSAQLMGNTRLLTGAFPANYGDALGGFMDLNLRKGNSMDSEHTLQAGLLGLDLATEGPFSKNSDASYLVNYRYSTIGILEAMGVEVSPEKINFQDLAFNVNIPTKKESEWSAFGMLGLSSEKFEAERDTTLWEINEDRVDTKFISNMGAIGITNKMRVGNRSSLNTVIAYSKIKAERNASYVDDDLNALLIESDLYGQELLSFNGQFKYNLNRHHQFYTGLTLNHIGYDLRSAAASNPGETLSNTVQSKGNYQVVKLYTNWSAALSPKVIANLGVHVLYFNLNDELSIEPRAGLEFLLSPRSTFRFNYGLVSQSHFPQIYFVVDTMTNNLPNMNLKLAKSHQGVVSFDYQLNPVTSISLEGYYQYHYNVPVSTNPNSTFSLLNAVDAYIEEQLTNGGSGEYLGVELMINRAFKNGYYFLVSSSLYDANYKALDGVKRKTRFNGNYNSSLSIGKEIVRITNTKNKIVGFNLRFLWQGGYRHTPIDLDASKAAGETVYLENQAFSQKYDDFIRADVRVYLKKNKEKYTRTLSLDIQNATAQQNIAYQYFDPFTEKVETKYQLGLLPFLTYRVEF